jgi:hypothetical protein
LADIVAANTSKTLYGTTTFAAYTVVSSGLPQPQRVIDTELGPARFAAGELSNGAWCFYEPIAEA